MRCVIPVGIRPGPVEWRKAAEEMESYAGDGAIVVAALNPRDDVFELIAAWEEGE